MSGGFTPGIRREEYVLDGGASFLASEHYIAKRVGITLDADAVTADADGNKIVDEGTFVVEDAATGLYVPYVDGTETPIPTEHDASGYTFESVNLRHGNTVCGLLIHGSVLSARVNPTPVPAAVRTATAGRILHQ